MRKIETPLITEDLLKLYSNISRNVNVEKVIPYISMAESFFVEPIIGTALITDLRKCIANKQEDEEYEIPEHYQALLLKIAPCEALYVEYLAMRPLAYTVTEKGIVKQKSENSESIGESELGQMILDVKNKAEMAARLLKEYLCNCKDKYPLYRADESVVKEKSLIYNPIYLPKRGCGKCGCK